jgi:hypothetical protein
MSSRCFLLVVTAFVFGQATIIFDAQLADLQLGKCMAGAITVFRCAAAIDRRIRAANLLPRHGRCAFCRLLKPAGAARIMIASAAHKRRTKDKKTVRGMTR